MRGVGWAGIPWPCDWPGLCPGKGLDTVGADSRRLLVAWHTCHKHSPWIQRRPVTAAGGATRPRDDPADHPRDRTPARRPHPPAPPEGTRHALAGLATPPSGPLTLVPPARTTSHKRRNHPGQLAIGGCRTSRCHPSLNGGSVLVTSFALAVSSGYSRCGRSSWTCRWPTAFGRRQPTPGWSPLNHVVL